MADSVILNIKSWRSSETTGRKHLVDISPQFTSDSSYVYEEMIIGADDELPITCGKYFTYVWTDKIVNYTIDGSDIIKHGQLIMLTDNVLPEELSTILITGVTALTKVTFMTVT